MAKISKTTKYLIATIMYIEYYSRKLFSKIFS